MSDSERPPKGDLFKATDPFVEWTDRTIHVVIGVLFLLVAIAIGVYSVAEFIREVGHNEVNFLVLAIDLINGLLLVLIILEVLGTVRSYLTEGHTSLKPFLVIGIISATRRVLAVGAETGVKDTFADEKLFRHLMIDLSVNALVVLVLALGLYLFAKAESADPEGMDTRAEREQRMREHQA